MKFLMIITALFLSACSSTQGLSVFSFSNADAELALTDKLPTLEKKLRVMGLPVKFKVDELSVNIGPDKRDVVSVKVASSAEIDAFVLNYPVALMFQIEAKPVYSSKDKAVFLQDINLLDSRIDAGGFKGNLGALDKDVMALLNGFLAKNPVYKLDMNNPKMALLSKLPLDIIVREGAIEVVPSL